MKGLAALIEQLEINRLIEHNATSQEKKAIELILFFSNYIINPNKKIRVYGVNLPPSTPRPQSPRPTPEELAFYKPKESDFSPDYILMKQFLETHPEYKTRAAQKIRKWYQF